MNEARELIGRLSLPELTELLQDIADEIRLRMMQQAGEGEVEK